MTPSHRPRHPHRHLRWTAIRVNAGSQVTEVTDLTDVKLGYPAGNVSTDRGRYLIVHNIGAGVQLEDLLFNYKVTGHFRYPSESNAS